MRMFNSRPEPSSASGRSEHLPSASSSDSFPIPHPRRLRRHLAAVLLGALPLLAAFATGAQAQVECTGDGPYGVPENWDLKPDNLAVGTSFRLLFVTSTTRNAQSTNIADYNTFVQDRAKAGHSAISDSCGDQFKVLGSTSSVDARDNTATTADPGLAIHWLDGAKVADNYNDFYDGTWDSRVGKDESGDSVGNSDRIFTGSTINGREYTSQGSFSTITFALGSNFVRASRLGVSASLSSSNTLQINQGRFYAISPVFTVEGTTTLSLGLASGSDNESNSSSRDVTINISPSMARLGPTEIDVCVKDTGTATFRTATGGQAQDFDILTLDDTSMSTDDNNCFGATIPASTATASNIGKLRIFGDTTPEADETVILELRNPPTNVAVSSTAGTATYTITNDDGTPPTITISGGAAVTEGTAAGFTLNTSPAPSSNITVQLDVSDDDSSDFLAAGDEGRMTQTVSASSTGFNVSTQNNNTDDLDGQVTVTIAEGDGYTVGSTSSANVTVEDDDPTIVSLARVGSGAVIEGDKVEFTVTLSRALIAGETIDVPLPIGGTGVTTSDWSLAEKSSATNTGVTLSDTGTATPKVRFSGASAQMATLELTTTMDGLPEGGSETFEIALGADSAFDDSSLDTNVGGGADPHSTNNDFDVTVNNNVAPVVSVSLEVGEGVSRTTAGELPQEENLGTTGVVFDLSANRELGADRTVCVRVTESGGDRVTSGNEGIKTVTLSSGGQQVNGAGEHTVTWTDTAADDRDSSVTVEVVAPDTEGCTGAGYTVSTTDSSDKIRILDDDSTEIELTSSDMTMAEDDASDTATLTVLLGRRLYAGEVVVVPITLATTTGARLPGSTDNNNDANNDFMISAAAATEQSGVTLANALTANPRVVFTGDDSNTVQTATVTLTPVANRDDGDAFDETITATLATDSVLSATGLGTTVSGGASRHSSNFMASLTLADDEADKTAPQVTSITRQTPSTSHTTADSLTWQVTFSEPVQNVDAADFRVSNTNAMLAVSQVSDTDAYDVTASGGDLQRLDATVTLSFDGSHDIQDMVGNALASNPTLTGTDNSFVVDNTLPNITSITRRTPFTSPTNADSLTWNLAFSEAVENLDKTDFQVSNTTADLTVSQQVEGSNVYQVTASGGDLENLDDTVTLSFDGDHDIQDMAGNYFVYAPLPTYTIVNYFVVDNTAPTVTITGLSGTISSAVTAIFTFSEPVTDFTLNDIVVTGGTVSNFAVVTAGRIWSARITPSVNGTTVTINVPVNAAQDQASRGSAAATATANYIATLSAPVGFTASPGNGRVSLSWSAPDNSANGEALTNYQYRYQAGSSVATATWTDVADGTDDGSDLNDETALTVTGLTNGTRYAFELRAVNAAGNGAAATATATPSSSDTTPPQVTSITRQTPSTSPTNANSLTWKVTFSEPVQNVDAADFQVSGTTAPITSVSRISNTNVHVTTSGDDLASLDDMVTLSFKASHDIRDMAGNALASNPRPVGTNANNFVVDNTAPQVTSITHQPPSSSPTNADSLTWEVTFSEPVQNVDAADFQVSGTTDPITSVSQISNTNAYAVTTSGDDLASLDDTVTLSFKASHDIRDTAGNALAPSATPTITNNNSFVVDNTAPTVTITGLSGTISSVVTATFTFSKTVTDFTSSDIVVTGGTVSNFAVVTADRIWSARITPSGNGTAVTINVPVNAAQDQAGNGNTAATARANYVVTLSAPVGFTASPGNGQVALSWSAPGNSANGEALTQYQYRYQAGSSVTTGTWTDVADGDDDGSDLNDETALTVTGLTNGTRYAFELRAVNAAGNGATATAMATPSSSDTTAPLVTSIVRHSPSSSSTNADSLTWRVTFSEPVQNVDATDFQVSNTTATLTVSQVSGMNVYDVTASDGNLAGLNATVTLSFNGSHNIQDTAGNALVSSPTPSGTDHPSYVVDNTAPNVTSITHQSPSSSPTNTDSLTWRVTFDEPVQNVDAADFQVSNTTATLTVSQVSGRNTYDVTASGGNLAGLDTTVTLSFKASHDIRDTAGNALIFNPTPTETNNNSFVVQTTPTPPPTTPTPPPTASTPVVSISAGAPSVTEGDAISFTLSANPPPEAGTTITVNISVAEGGSVAASSQIGGRPVAISTSGMASFTVATDDDTIYEPDGSITATVQAGAGYRPQSSNASAAVSVKDNDPGLELSTSNLRVSKGGSISYTIALATQPDSPVMVSISGHEATGLTADATSLDFTPSTWNVPQEVTLTAPGKAASITLTHTATGGNYGGIEAEVVVTVIALDPKARQGWLSRFGRTVSHQVVAGIQDRFTAAPPPPGLHLTVAGEEFINATPLAENQQVLAKALGFETITGHQLVEGSAFSFAPSADGNPAQFAIWGQGALASFSGAEDSLSLDGDVSTALLGAEWSGARWLAGAALSHSWGSGDYAEDNTVAGGDISSTLTGIFPYGRYRLTPRLGIWAVAGYGWGDLTLEPDGDSADYSPGTTMTMGAVGMDGLLLDGGAEGLSLTTTADALLVQTTSEAVAGLASSDANISRLRLGLEANRPVPLANGASLLPSLELGIRQDSGDAETGFGMELGAGLVWTDSGRGISAALKGRTLLTHADEEFQEQGLAVSFAWEPNPTNRGPSLALSHAVGAVAEGGMDALLSPTTMESLDVTPSRQHQFETKLAYGFPVFNDRLTLTPGVGLALSPDSRTYSLLWALAPYAQQPQAEPWQLSLEGERQEDNAADSSVEHSLKLRFSLPF